MKVFAGERNRNVLLQNYGGVVQKSGVRLPPLGLDLRIHDRYHVASEEENKIDIDLLDDGYDDPGHENYNPTLAKKVKAQKVAEEKKGKYSQWGFGTGRRMSLTAQDMDSDDEAAATEKFGRIA